MSRKIVIVTDRVNLDKQIDKTFRHCGLEPTRAKSGRDLITLLRNERTSVITTVVDKFEAAMKTGERFDSSDIVVLVDEGHRSHYGSLSAQMQRTLPNACYIGFTGTPLMRRDKSTVERFGGLIDTYTIRQAERDKVVVPLYYEGRHVDQQVEQPAIDRWFDRITEPLTREQRGDLKRKFTRASQLDAAEKKIASVAFDVAMHFAANWQGTGSKGILVAPDKSSALKYKAFLDETGLVSSEVIISPPDQREGEDEAASDRRQDVIRFWNAMMTRYENEDAYNDGIIDDYLHEEKPEILIVVDKLLVGFDAPAATVLYLTRKLQDHTLLQAIARVNRVHPGKDAGFIIDYAGVLENLDRALDLYGHLPDFDRDDLLDTVHEAADLGDELRQSHAVLLDLFSAVPPNRRHDREALERHLADDALRHEFYEKLSAFLRALQHAMASADFLEGTPAATIRKYRDDAKGYEHLRRSVRHRYQEVVDYGEYADRISKLLDRHVGAAEPLPITPLVNVFDTELFKQEVERQSSPGSKADAIAYALDRTITERMEEDPVFFERFGKLVKEAIDAYRQQRLDDAAYLQHVLQLRDQVVNGDRSDVPESVRYDAEARAVFGVVRDAVKPEYIGNAQSLDAVSAEAARAITEIVQRRRTVNWTRNQDVQNQMKNDIEDYLYRFERGGGPKLSPEKLENLLDRSLTIALRRAG